MCIYLRIHVILCNVELSRSWTPGAWRICPGARIASRPTCRGGNGGMAWARKADGKAPFFMGNMVIL